MIIILCVAVTAEIIHIQALYKVANIVLNPLGVTWFEKIIASIICFVQIIHFVYCSVFALCYNNRGIFC